MRSLRPLLIGLVVGAVALGFSLPLLALLPESSPAPTPAAAAKATPTCPPGSRYVKIEGQRFVAADIRRKDGQCVPSDVITQLEAQLRQRPLPSTPAPFRSPPPSPFIQSP